MLDEALAKTPDDKKLKLLWAKASLGMGDTEKAKDVLSKFNEGDDQYREAKSLLELLDFHAEAAKQDVQGKEAVVYHEACKLACAEDFESALQAFLNLYVEAPEWNDSAAKKAMLTLFGVLGPKHITIGPEPMIRTLSMPSIFILVFSVYSLIIKLG